MRVAIVGYGIEGQSSYRYFSKNGAHITVFDQADIALESSEHTAAVVTGVHYIDELKKSSFDIVLRSPQISPALLGGVSNVSSLTREFFRHCPAPIIAVTGTKGKGTTSSFIASILREAGKTVHLVGNIGVPAFDVLDSISSDDVVVYEISSFQLWDMDRSPHVAVVLMIEPDHLDVHASYEEYVNAKSNIAQFQSIADIVVYNPKNTESTRIAGLSRGKKMAYGGSSGVYVKDNDFYINAHKICSTSTVVIPGKHNVENATAAISAVWEFTQDIDAISRGLHSFQGLPHRLRFVREINNVRYFDDSIATTTGSAIAALRSFDEPKILILGGSDKGTEYDSLIDEILSQNIKKVLCIGKTGTAIAGMLTRKNFAHVSNLGEDITMPEIVSNAADIAEPGDVVILSPASASFGMFKNYSDRGDQFVAAVNDL